MYPARLLRGGRSGSRESRRLIGSEFSHTRHDARVGLYRAPVLKPVRVLTASQRRPQTCPDQRHFPESIGESLGRFYSLRTVARRRGAWRGERWPACASTFSERDSRAAAPTPTQAQSRPIAAAVARARGRPSPAESPRRGRAGVARQRPPAVAAKAAAAGPPPASPGTRRPKARRRVLPRRPAGAGVDPRTSR